jgi:hypothetical protein
MAQAPRLLSDSLGLTRLSPDGGSLAEADQLENAAGPHRTAPAIFARPVYQMLALGA